MQPSNVLAANRTAQICFHSTTGGWVEVNPDFVAALEALGLTSPRQFLDLPGEVVSGHPDRHVVRVNISGFSQAFYLKKQHFVTWREKFRNWDAGFGWVTRSEREGEILRRLAEDGLPCPRWAAVGVDGRGRAFLLVEELTSAVDLRQHLHDGILSNCERAGLAARLGQWIAAYHNSGYTTPELTAKHVMVNSVTDELTLIDWQSAQRASPVSLRDRSHSLAALHASLSEHLASPRERLRVFREATRDIRQDERNTLRFPDIVRLVLTEANRLANRRSIRDQRQPPSSLNQKLVWVAGEAVCAVPQVAAIWQSPAIAAPYYGCEPGTLPVVLPDGRNCVLVRGRSVAPYGRFRAWLRGRSWRSPGVTLGRVLFHLERYGIPAPGLLAFGQRFTGPMSAEWFALHTPPATPLGTPPDFALAAQLGRILRQLHDAGCSIGDNPLASFGIEEGTICIRDPRAIRIAKPKAERELGLLLATLSPWVRKTAELSYRTGQRPVPQSKRARALKIDRLIPAQVIQ